MIRTACIALAASLALLTPAVSSADDGKAGKSAPTTVAASIELDALMRHVAKLTKQSVLADHRAPARVAAGTAELRDVTFPLFLSILTNNELAAVTIDGAINVVPLRLIRQHPIPTVDADDAGLPDALWVSRTIALSRVSAPKLVPILRPLLPKEGHLTAAAEANALLIVAPYGNVRRITDLATELDSRTESGGESR